MANTDSIPKGVNQTLSQTLYDLDMGQNGAS